MPLLKLQISQIQIDTGLQCREKQDVDVITEYAAAYKANAKLPPPVVFNDGKQRWLADGFHRVPAAKQAGLKTLMVDERKGTKRDAVLFAVGANADHGLRRTNADKRRAVVCLLEDAEWCTWPAREIARRCAVTHMLVVSIKKDLEMLATTASDATGAPLSEAKSEPKIKSTRKASNPEKHGGGGRAEAPASPAQEAGLRASPAAEDFDPFDAPDNATGQEKALHAAYGAHAAVRDIATRILALVRDWEAIGQDAHPYISAQAVTAYLQNAQADIRMGQPHAVCPYCQGQTCDACRGTGWVPKSVFDAAPAETKENAVLLE